MRVLTVNTTFGGGGAAIAARRLTEALRQEGVEARMMVATRAADAPAWVTGVSPAPLYKARFAAERGLVWAANGFRRDGLFGVDIAAMGADITSTEEFRKADIIHLHWINQGFMSMHGLRKVFISGKPVVWTLHDMWPFTGICHYPDGCRRFGSRCHDCPQLHGINLPDPASILFHAKSHAYRDARITFVGCSRWIADAARKSKLTHGHRVVDIPNPFPVDEFAPVDVMQARARLGLPPDKKILLFASAKVTDPRKGMTLLAEACNRLADEGKAQFEVAIMGARSPEVAAMFTVKVHSLGFLTDPADIRCAYSSADLFAIPSLQDNLPNTIVEAMSCGTPTVAFATGGIPQMIAHGRTGYLAREGDSTDLARGIDILVETGSGMKENCRQSALDTYRTARDYISLYRELLASTAH